jgi:hypothetical protein
MSKILEIREKRAKAWDAAKAFLDSKRDESGLLNAEDSIVYDRMEADVVALGKEVERLERQAAIDLELSKPTNMPIKNTPTLPDDDDKTGRASNAYRGAFWNVMRKRPMIGIMAVESERRKQAWLQTGCNNFDSKHPVSKPMSFWTNRDALQYIRDYQLPIASVYGDIMEDNKGRLFTTGEQRTGCVFCPVGCHRDKVNRFQRMAVSHPKLHDYCMSVLGLGAFLDFIGVEYRERGGADIPCHWES